MNFLSRLSNWFSSQGRDDNQLSAAMDLAKNKQPTEAIKIYSELIQSGSVTGETRARALFNRALAHSSMKDDVKAIADLKKLVALPDVPENVRTAARNQLVRLQNRSEV